MRILWERSDFPLERVFFSKASAPRDPADLQMSHYVVDPATGFVTHKTCTYCSQEQGRFVWYLISTMGFRIMGDRTLRTQAQCPGCRGRYSKLKRVA
jgi:hypothetical protein